MIAIMIVQVNNYTDPGSIKINGVYIIHINCTLFSQTIDGVICTRTQVFLTLAFVMTMYKYQRLKLCKVVLSFYHKLTSLSTIMFCCYAFAISTIWHLNSSSLMIVFLFHQQLVPKIEQQIHHIEILSKSLFLQQQSYQQRYIIWILQICYWHQ